MNEINLLILALMKLLTTKPRSEENEGERERREGDEEQIGGLHTISGRAFINASWAFRNGTLLLGKVVGCCSWSWQSLSLRGQSPLSKASS